MRRAYSFIAGAVIITVLLTGCGDKSADTDIQKESPSSDAVVTEIPSQEPSQIEVMPLETPTISPEEDNSAESSVSEETVQEDTLSEEDSATETESSDDSSPKSGKIVWLGDSLTQGSLGDDNDNLANAPFEKLKAMTKVPVEGYGLYGYKTNTIFWVYVDGDHYNQEVVPENTYIFWVGSNDWVVDGVPNADTQPVISQIDDFLTKFCHVKKYIVIGTTSRYELGDMYKSINKDLAAHYGEHYLDVIDIVNKYGYVGDNIHLSQASYDAVAKAVYEKLKKLGYI